MPESDPPPLTRDRYCAVRKTVSRRLDRAIRRELDGRGGGRVLVERRARERRAGDRRHRSDAHAGAERRRIHNEDGRRVADRRAPTVDLGTRALPRAFRAVEGVHVLERVPPTERQLEDAHAARLVIRSQVGDKGAFDALYSIYFERVFAYVRLALKDRHEAEDITQDVFLSILGLLPRFEIRRDTPFRVLLFQIARNRIIDHLRKHGVVDVEPPEKMGRRCDRADWQEADAAVNRLSDGDLAILVRRLPSAQRQAIVLRYTLDFDAAEIAQIMETTPQAVRNLQHRALAALRKRLVELNRDPVRVTRVAMFVREEPTPVLLTRRLALTPLFGTGAGAWSFSARRSW